MPSLEVLILILALIALGVPLGEYMARVFQGERTFLSPALRPLERGVYRLCRIDENEEMGWKTYLRDVLLFSVLGIVFLFGLQLLQGVLPLNPQHFGHVRWDTALNAAVSFVTNTNWQSYAGESTMSHLTQMLGLTVQNFVSAAVGLAVAIVFIRSFVRREASTIGNFWVDLTRGMVYILLPLAVLWAILLLSQGAVQTLAAHATAHTLEGTNQTISVGPVASQEAIKILGNNGGGFFNANSAHPFENPTPFSNFLENLGLLLLPASLPFAYGAMLKRRRQGIALFSVMLILFALGLGAALLAEHQANPVLHQASVVGANLEGKEVRFGVSASAMFAQSTTATSTGAVIASHDSLMPLTGGVLIFNMAIGEVVFGGIGTGLTGLLLYAIVTMFLAGLMIGRTPEFLRKKLEPREMIWATIGVLGSGITLLVLAGIAILVKPGLAGLLNHGPHGLSEMLYAYASPSNNNGSAFAGISANTPFFNLTTAFAMLVGRFGATILPPLAIAGSLVGKKAVAESTATFPTTGPLFVGMLAGVVVIVGALTFLPVIALGPVLEHLLLFAGHVF